MTKAEKIIKKISIGLVIIAIITFLIVSSKVYNTPQKQFEQNYSKLTIKEKKMAKTLKKTGEVQSKVIGKNRVKGNGKFIDEVQKTHKNDKKKNWQKIKFLLKLIYD